MAVEQWGTPYRDQARFLSGLARPGVKLTRCIVIEGVILGELSSRTSEALSAHDIADILLAAHIERESQLSAELLATQRMLSAKERELVAQERELEQLANGHRRAEGELAKLLQNKMAQAALSSALAAQNPFPHLKKLPRRLFRTLNPKGKPLHLDEVRTILRTLAKTPPGSMRPFRPQKSVIRKRVRAAAIMDEFTEQCFRYEWDLLLLDPKNWRAELEKNPVDLLFVESAWWGNSRTWSYFVTNWEKEGNPLPALVAFCKEKGIPTVFWNKEDPPNFDRFKESAAHFEYIFTTDGNCIPEYRKLVDHNNIYALPFAAAQVIHNPTSRPPEPLGDIAFGGGWYENRHTERVTYLTPLLEATVDAKLKLDIFDRFSDLDAKTRKKHTFPSKYQAAVRPKLTYDEMLTAYRSYPVFLNVNSVIDSPTMFSRRVFELLACGTRVISGPSEGMSRMLGDYVASASTAEEAKVQLAKLVPETWQNRILSHRGSRHVLQNHTYTDRANEILAKIGRAELTTTRSPKVSVVVPTNRPQNLHITIENFRRQSYENKELLLVLNSDAFDLSEVRRALEPVGGRFIQLPEAMTLGSCLNQSIDETTGDYWAKFDDDDFYGAHYLGDSLLPFSYTDAFIVGKWSYLIRFNGQPNLYLRHPRLSHCYSELVCGGTMVVKRDTFSRLRFEDRTKGEDSTFMRNGLSMGFRTYSADPFNFVQRRDPTGAGHTWEAESDELIKNAQLVTDKFDESLVDI